MVDSTMEMFLVADKYFGVAVTDYETSDEFAEALFSKIDTDILRSFMNRSNSDSLIALIKNELKKRGELS